MQVTVGQRTGGQDHSTVDEPLQVPHARTAGEPTASLAVAPTRLRPPRTRSGHTYDFNLGGLVGQLTVTELPDRRPIEVVLTVGKQGSTLSGLGKMLSQMTSLALQHQAAVVDVVRLLIGTRFEPAGMTG